MPPRRPAFAGSWYPGSERACRAEIERLLESVEPREEPAQPRGGIVPHAGWIFSGRAAAAVFRTLGRAPAPDTVLLFGGHLPAGLPSVMMPHGSWATPLGEIAVDEELARVFAGEFEFTLESASRFRDDNTIELQLPFLKHIFPDSRVVAVGVAPGPDALALGERAVSAASGLGRNVLVVGSTDLTHYGPNYGWMPAGTGADAVRWVKEENDRRAVDRMLALDAGGLLEEAAKSRNACCYGAAAAALAAARALGAKKGHLADYYTSYDVQPSSSFVGYAGIVF